MKWAIRFIVWAVITSIHTAMAIAIGLDDVKRGHNEDFTGYITFMVIGLGLANIALVALMEKLSGGK